MFLISKNVALIKSIKFALGNMKETKERKSEYRLYEDSSYNNNVVSRAAYVPLAPA